MFRAFSLVILASLPIIYIFLFKGEFEAIYAGFIFLATILIYLVFSWFTSQKAISYSPKEGSIDLLLDIVSITITEALVFLWLFKAEMYFGLSRQEYFMGLFFYVALFLVTLVETYMTFKNALYGARKINIGGD